MVGKTCFTSHVRSHLSDGCYYGRKIVVDMEEWNV